jgi:glycosyltransferase involved in cell wall biosynthesis
MGDFVRILMVTRGVLPIAAGCGGAELMSYNLARTMALRGEQVTLLTEIDDECFAPVEGLEVIRVATRFQRLTRRLPRSFPSWLLQHLAGNVAVARRARAVLRRREFDVVHTNGGLSTILIARQAGTPPIVYTEHDASPWLCRYRKLHERFVRKLVYRLVNVRAFRAADRIVPVFSDLAVEMTDRWRVDPGSITAIPTGTDIDLFNPAGAGISLLEEFDIERYCLFVGSLEARKSPDALLEAVAAIDGLPCVFVGGGPDRKKLEHRAAELGVADRVFFTGVLAPSELGRVYAEADVFVLPSISEGMPLVLLEAMACGVAVLATRLSGVASLVDDWETGILVKPGETGELVMGLRMLERDPEFRHSLGENGRLKVLEQFPWPVVAARYLRTYQATGSGPADAPEPLDLPGAASVLGIRLPDATAALA